MKKQLIGKKVLQIISDYAPDYASNDGAEDTNEKSNDDYRQSYKDSPNPASGITFSINLYSDFG